eukprot:365362-Chlamydomonas_euryale.AAC.7
MELNRSNRTTNLQVVLLSFPVPPPDPHPPNCPPPNCNGMHPGQTLQTMRSGKAAHEASHLRRTRTRSRTCDQQLAARVAQQVTQLRWRERSVDVDNNGMQRGRRKVRLHHMSPVSQQQRDAAAGRQAAAARQPGSERRAASSQL